MKELVQLLARSLVNSPDAVEVKETLGDAWLTNTRYRFGASSLLNDLLRQLEHSVKSD